MTEAQVVAAAQCGENAAFDVLCQAHSEKLLRTVSRITRNHHDAQEAVQESLLSVFLHIDRFDGRSSFSTWVTRIAINTALMTLRRKRKCREISLNSGDGMIFDRAATTKDPEKQFAEQERMKLVRDEIARLRTSIRRPLILHELQGHSCREMAQMLGVSIPAAKSRLLRARKVLRKSEVLRSFATNSAPEGVGRGAAKQAAQ